MRRFGFHYLEGEWGLEQDITKGSKWLHLAADAGDGFAACCIGGDYYWGQHGVERDFAKAVEHFQRSANEMGYIPAYSFLGHCQIGIGKIEEGVLNCRKAAMSGLNDKDLPSLLRSA